MNGLLTKLNIIRSNTLVKQGQMLYNGSEDLFTKEGKKLSEGLYLIKSVQLTHSNEGCDENKKRYLHNLNLVAVECDGINKLSLKSGNINISIDSNGFQSHFGMGKNAAKGIIYSYIKDQFLKANKEGFKENVDYDKIFNKMAWSVMHRSPVKISKGDAQDIIVDALMQTVTSKTVEEFDPKRDIVKFFGSMFYNRMISEMKRWTTHKITEQEGNDSEEDFTQEETLDFRRKDDQLESPEDILKYKELIKDLRGYIKKRVRGKEQLKILEDMMRGDSSQEIAEKYNVSNSLVSRYTNDIRKSILEYAEKTNNTKLNYLMSKHSKKRMHSEADVTFIYNVFKEYKKKFGSDITSRKPSGDIIKVKKTVLEDKISDSAIANTILSDSYSSKALKEDLKLYFSLLDEQDELIDSCNGKLTGLKIVSDKVRNVEEEFDKKKTKLAKKEKGFFVYSKANLGPHKVLKADGTFSIKMARGTPIKFFKSKMQAEKAASRFQHTKLNLCVGIYPDEYFSIKEK
jgi:RNA polymerase sigma factor (sigma-70 family)